MIKSDVILDFHDPYGAIVWLFCLEVILERRVERESKKEDNRIDEVQSMESKNELIGFFTQSSFSFDDSI